jgi:hypothetical protein
MCGFAGILQLNIIELLDLLESEVGRARVRK